MIENKKLTTYIVIAVVIVIILFLVFYMQPAKEVAEIVTEEAVEEAEVIETTSEFKLLKQEGSRATNTVKGIVKNINGTESSVTIKVRLYLRGQVVAEQSTTLDDVKIFEEREFEIKFDDPPTWSAFDVEII